ncbi:prepilin-type N-terminal cleavage/methylation domain-containing protein [Pseudomonas wenzhouensis]|nr:prepilin-type N-terminal cleavage/methylation domain-containing protein [Pseudomonas wenzhouensis]MDM9650225.1 prepilin-type N-terminal cleavage/methylation domain-containing protein [Pseudomonas wenzhouensis]
MAFSYKQQGTSLIEAMVSMVLVAIMGLGLAYASSRTLLTQRYTTTQNLAALQMREKLQKPDENLLVRLGEDSLEMNYSPGNTPSITVTLNSVSENVTGVAVNRSVSTTSTSWFGGDGTVSIKTGTSQ